MSKTTLFLKRPAALRWVLAAMLCILCVGTYARVAASQFVSFDDDIEITKNPHIQGMGASNVAWMFTDVQQTERYTPLAWVVWGALYQGWGLNPVPFHLLGLVLHVMNTLLFFLVLMRMLRSIFGHNPDAPGATDALFAALGAGLWALHPLRVEVIAWATQVRFAEATLFSLLCVLAYFAAAERNPERPWRSGFYWLSVTAFAISLLFYPNGVGVVIVLMAADVLPLRRVAPAALTVRRAGRLFVEKIPFVMPALFVAAMTIYGRFAAAVGGGLFKAPVGMEAFGLGHRVMQALYIVAYYVWKPFDPFHLSPVYTQLFMFDPASWPFVLSAIGVAAMTVAALVLWRRAPWVAVLWVVHLALIFPFGGYFEHPHYPSDRYSYLQGVLGSVAVVMALAWLWQSGRRMMAGVGMIAGVVMMASLAALSAMQTSVWHDNKALFQSVLAALGDDPYHADITWRLAVVYLEEGRPAEALPLLKETLRVYPVSPQGLLHLERACGALAEPATGPAPDAATKRALYLQVAEAYDRAAAVAQQVDPMRIAAKYYALAGDWSDAGARMEAVISLETEDGADRLELARIYHEQHRDPEARQQLDRAVKSDSAASKERDRLLALWNATGTAPATTR
jgi:protein O-mannosyl-transferase